MLWLLGRQSGPPESDERKKLALVVCQGARLALPYRIEEDRMLVLRVIETVEAWVRGEATIEEVRGAAAAYTVAAAYAVAVAAVAVYTVAVYIADAAAYTAVIAADIAAVAAAEVARVYTAADVAAYAAAKAETLARCADIVRQHYPQAPAFVAKKRGSAPSVASTSVVS